MESAERLKQKVLQEKRLASRLGWAQTRLEAAERERIWAIASVAGTYQRMSQRGVRNLDELARQLVQRQTVALALEAEKALMPENAYTQKHRFGPRR